MGGRESGRGGKKKAATGGDLPTEQLCLSRDILTPALLHLKEYQGKYQGDFFDSWVDSHGWHARSVSLIGASWETSPQTQSRRPGGGDPDRC